MRARLLVSAGLLLLALWFARLTYLGWAIARDLRTTQALLAADPQQNLPGLAQSFHNLKEESGALRMETWPLLQVLPLARAFPYLGPTLASIPPLLNLAADVSLAADECLQTILPVIARPADQAPLPLLLQQTQANQSDLLVARQAAVEAIEERRAIPVDAPEFIVKRMQQLDPYLSVLQQVITTLAAAPELLGGNGPRTYLFLIQNSDEIRPSGGFISSVGILKFTNGSYTFQVQNSYALDDFLHQAYPPAPEPLHTYMGADLWLLRDSNWSPDFPTAARDVAGLYRLGQAESVSGVIAFDQTALKLLLQAFGPVTLLDGSGQVSAASLDQFLHDQWKPEPANLDPGSRTYSHGFMSGLAESITAELGQDTSSVDFAALLEAAQQILSQKHALVYLSQPDLASLLSEQGWDGAVSPGTQDYLFVVDSNLGFNKVNAALQKSLTYRVNLSDSFHPQADLSVQYHLVNQPGLPCSPSDNAYGQGNYESLTQGCYWNYLRVYVPGSSTLSLGQPHPSPSDWLVRKQYADGLVSVTSGESNTQVFNQFFVVPSGGQLAAHLTYGLPPSVVQYNSSTATYCLHIQKQPGTQADSLGIEISLPSAALIQAATPPPSTESQGLLSYQLNLETDRNLCLTFTR